jgi:hypothetical protein
MPAPAQASVPLPTRTTAPPSVRTATRSSLGDNFQIASALGALRSQMSS